MEVLRAFSPGEPAGQISSVKDVERRGWEMKDGEPALAFWRLMVRERTEQRSQECPAPRVPIHQGC